MLRSLKQSYICIEITYKRKKGNPNTTLEVVINCESTEHDEREKDPQNNPETDNKVAMRTFIPIITLNVNGPNTLIKRQRVLNGYRNKTIYMLCRQDFWISP